MLGFPLGTLSGDASWVRFGWCRSRFWVVGKNILPEECKAPKAFLSRIDFVQLYEFDSVCDLFAWKYMIALEQRIPLEQRIEYIISLNYRRNIWVKTIVKNEDIFSSIHLYGSHLGNLQTISHEK